MPTLELSKEQAWLLRHCIRIASEDGSIFFGRPPKQTARSLDAIIDKLTAITETPKK